VTTPTDPATFADICGDLPDHATEVMTSHEGRPTAAAQAPKLPGVDRGEPTGPAKYQGAGLGI
jgi:hypothetical protein